MVNLVLCKIKLIQEEPPKFNASTWKTTLHKTVVNAKRLHGLVVLEVFPNHLQWVWLLKRVTLSY